MNPDPTIVFSWDYLVDFTDDGMEPAQREPEVVTIPPAAPVKDLSPAPPSLPEQRPQA
jgi:hypothetical protein